MWSSRSQPFVVRYPNVALSGARLARHADVVYATATYAAAAAAAFAVRKPLVAKLVSDPAYERAYRYRRFDGSLEEFERVSSLDVRALRQLRTWSLRRAHRIVVPSSYLAGIARGWGLAPDRIEVLLNPAPAPSEVTPAALEPGSFVFVGRLTRQKALPIALQALARVPEARLVIVGDGPLRALLERDAARLGVSDRVRFVGAFPRAEVLAQLAGAHALILTSDWENMPHAVIEALSVGTPVLATAVGGVPEVVRDGENGLLVPPGDVDALALGMRRLLDPVLRDRFAATAKESVSVISRDRVYGRLEAVLAEAAER